MFDMAALLSPVFRLHGADPLETHGPASAIGSGTFYANNPEFQQARFQAKNSAAAIFAEFRREQ
jgi:hypothetical protein